MTNKPVVTLKRFEEEGPNGDRATTMTKYFNYEVAVNDFVVQVFDGFDHWNCHVNKPAEVKNKALEYTKNLAEALKVDMPNMLGMKRVETVSVDWVEEKVDG